MVYAMARVWWGTKVAGCLRAIGETISERGEVMRGMLTVTLMKDVITRVSLMGMECILGETTGNSMKGSGTWGPRREKESGVMLRETAILGSGNTLR
jgi:hypothetical protein